MLLKYLAINLKGNITCISCRKKFLLGDQAEIIGVAMPGRSMIIRASTGAVLHRCDLEVVLWCPSCRKVENRPIRDVRGSRRRRSRVPLCRSCYSPLRRQEL